MKNYPDVNFYSFRIAKHFAKIWLALAAVDEEIRRMSEKGFHDDARPFKEKVQQIKNILRDYEEDDSLDD